MTISPDTLKKDLFSFSPAVRDLVLGFVKDNWLHGLDFTTLEKVPSEFVAGDPRQRASDVIWRIKADDGEWKYVYFMLEFERGVDPWMAVRVMSQVGLLYLDLIRRGLVLEGHRLPPVLPIVLYNGDAQWSATKDVADLISTPPGLVAQCIPRLSYLLIEQNQSANEDLADMRNLAATMIRTEHPVSPKALPQVVRQIAERVDDDADLKQTSDRRFEAWAKGHEQRGLEKGRLEGQQEGRLEGQQEGLLEGTQLALQGLLTKRFGPLPEDVLGQIGSASIAQIDTWLDRLLIASSLDEIFKVH